jgi:hypothetical protein
LAAGTNKNLAKEVKFETEKKLLLGQYDFFTQKTNTISLSDLSWHFLSSKRNQIKPSSLKRYQNYFDKFISYIEKFFPGPSLNVATIKTIYVEECFNYFLESEITNGKKWEPKTVNGIRTILIQLFEYGIRQNYLSKNPVNTKR